MLNTPWLLVCKWNVAFERPPRPAKVMPNYAGRDYSVISATGPTAVKLGFLDRSHCYFFQVAPHLSSRGWVDPVIYPLFVRTSGSAGNRARNIWICSQELWPLDHRGVQPPSWRTKYWSTNLPSALLSQRNFMCNTSVRLWPLPYQYRINPAYHLTLCNVIKEPPKVFSAILRFFEHNTGVSESFLRRVWRRDVSHC
jgi:hypothetical protein